MAWFFFTAEVSFLHYYNIHWPNPKWLFCSFWYFFTSKFNTEFEWVCTTVTKIRTKLFSETFHVLPIINNYHNHTININFSRSLIPISFANTDLVFIICEFPFIFKYYALLVKSREHIFCITFCSVSTQNILLRFSMYLNIFRQYLTRF